MGVYDEEIADALELLEEFGGEVTVKTAVRGARDPAQPNRPPPATVTLTPTRAAFFDYAQRYIDGTTIIAGDQRVYMPAVQSDGVSPVSPTLDSVILRGSEVWKVIRAAPLAPNGERILYELQVRSA